VGILSISNVGILYDPEVSQCSQTVIDGVADPLIDGFELQFGIPGDSISFIKNSAACPKTLHLFDEGGALIENNYDGSKLTVAEYGHYSYKFVSENYPSIESNTI
jgi:hypothetical protein